eukprot:1927632-Rhodomonas_salina.1
MLFSAISPISSLHDVPFAELNLYSRLAIGSRHIPISFATGEVSANPRLSYALESTGSYRGGVMSPANPADSFVDVQSDSENSLWLDPMPKGSLQCDRSAGCVGLVSTIEKADSELLVRTKIAMLARATAQVARNCISRNKPLSKKRTRA